MEWIAIEAIESDWRPVFELIQRHLQPSSKETIMRYTAVLCVLAYALPAFGQDNGEAQQPPVQVERWEVPKTTEVGEEFTVTAHLKHIHARVALISVRFHTNDNVELLEPQIEKFTFTESDLPQSMSWKVKRSALGPMNGFIESSVVIEKHGPGHPIPEAEKAALEREWAGKFTQPGAAFDAQLRLRVLDDGAVEGKIHWTYTKTDDEKAKRNVGLSGTECVWGSYDPTTRLLVFDGYRRDDPHMILGLDRYRLTLGENGQTLGGTTWANGTNEGRFNLTPKKAE
jgi:hypothetical protein